MGHDDISVVICCAGMGTRLGIGTTKALVKIAGKSIIQRQLEMLDEYDDIRVAVGYQAEKVIKEVKHMVEVLSSYRCIVPRNLHLDSE